MGEPPGQPPATPRRRHPLHHLRYLALVIFFLSGPVMFSLAAAGSFTTKNVDACQDKVLETPWDYAASKSQVTFDESVVGDGWGNVIGDRDATELAALTVDQQNIRLHSASWPVQPKADAKLYFYSAGEIADLLEQARDEADTDEEPTDDLRRSLFRAQWIAKNSLWNWDYPDRPDKLQALPSKHNEAAARQLAIWHVVDGVGPESYSAIPPEISRRAQELVELANYYTPPDGEQELGNATVGAWSARGDGQLLIKALVGRSDGTDVPNQPLTFDFPGGRVLARTNQSGEVCVSLPETIGETPPTVAVRWERYIPPGSFFAAQSFDSVAVEGADADMDATRVLANRPFVAVTLNGFRDIDQLTLSIPPRE